MNNLLKDGLTSAKGYKEYKKFVEGGTLSYHQTILADCFCCCTGYFDGKEDCENNECVCYPFMPYGKIVKNKPKRQMSEKQKEAVAKMRQGKK
jgi:hypothetical protein